MSELKKSKIPVKTRQVSVPVQLIDDSVYCNAKKSSIPRITSSPLLKNKIVTLSAGPSTPQQAQGGPPQARQTGVLESIETNSPLASLNHKLHTLSIDSPSTARALSKRNRVQTPQTEKVATRHSSLNHLNNNSRSTSIKRSGNRIFSNDSPLIERLTRSTTSSDLKSVVRHPPRATTISNKGSNNKLVIQKRRSKLPKSTTMNSNINKIIGDDTNGDRIASCRQLYQELMNNEKAKQTISSWNESLDFSNYPKFSVNSINYQALTKYEKTEILKLKQIYYIDLEFEARAVPNVSNNNNFGFDDVKKNLIINRGNHISYRYKVIDKLGTGMFGNVLKCYDYKDKKIVSIKIMKNDILWSLQSINEIKILKKLNNNKNILNYIEHFNFRSHICVVTELLYLDMFKVLEFTNYKGFSIGLIKEISKQLLNGLKFIHSNGIIHGDLKPENIMLCEPSPNRFNIKIIDFGSSSKLNEISFPYIQSRFYRSPEVLIGARYDYKIDVWSFGCIVYELFIGSPLFPARNEIHLFNLIIKKIGFPLKSTIIELRNEILAKGSISNHHNDNDNEEELFIDRSTIIFTKFDSFGNYKGNKIEFNEIGNGMDSKIFDLQFLNFLKKIITWDVDKRWSCEKLLTHGFLQ